MDVPPARIVTIKTEDIKNTDTEGTLPSESNSINADEGVSSLTEGTSSLT